MVDVRNYFVKIYVYFQDYFYREKRVFIVQIILYFIYLLVINIIKMKMINNIIL